MEGLSFQYPIWYLGLCILSGLAYALTLYFRDKESFKDKSPYLKWGLGLLRFLSVSLLATLLLAPLLKSFQTDVKNPIILIGQDNSQSIVSSMDESEIETYKNDFNSLITQLEEKYEVKTYSFGDDIKSNRTFNFDEKVSNLSDFIDYGYDTYGDQNLGAVIFASDGVFNEGKNPIYSKVGLKAPVFTVALGDTTQKRDLLIKHVYHNKIAYLGDKFSIQVDVLGKNCNGSRPTITVSRVDGKNTTKLFSKTIRINEDQYFHSEEVILNADRAGVQRYRVYISNIKDEISSRNNVKDIFIDVLDARQKVLILANTPHPDLSALKQSINTNKNYEVEVQYASKFQKNIANYDFVIFHQLPSQQNNIDAILSQLNRRNIPRWFIVGNQTNLNKFNQNQSVLTISGNSKNTNEVQTSIDSEFNLFKIDEQLKNNLGSFAPIIAPFGEFNASGEAMVLLKQKIGKVNTNYPLLAFSQKDNQKTAVLAAEGIWKWRLFDYLQHENTEIIDELILKSMQYLSVKEDKRKFRVSTAKNIYNENETILFDAELYNNSYELINEPDAFMVIKDSEGKEYNFTFNKTANYYTLDAGLFPEGNYTYSAYTNYNSDRLNSSGKFSIQPIQLELYETTANHGLLRNLSERFGGSTIAASNLSSLGNLIVNNENMKPVMFQTTKTRSVINIKWIFFLLLGLLVLEWFLRRFNGGY